MNLATGVQAQTHPSLGASSTKKEFCSQLFPKSATREMGTKA
jgi:hypothetical protein